jgi:hypothetical protein
MKERHLKMRLGGQKGVPVEAVWWNCLDQLEQTPVKDQSIEVAYTIESSIWNNEVKVQMNVADLKTVTA